jgi:hypothetical protein
MMELEMSAGLTEAAKKFFDDLLNVLQQKEVAIASYAEKMQAAALQAALESERLLEEAKRHSKVLIDEAEVQHAKTDEDKLQWAE